VQLAATEINVVATADFMINKKLTGKWELNLAYDL
jgi:hypothetical protein